jgi:hypothetical protein
MPTRLGLLVSLSLLFSLSDSAWSQMDLSGKNMGQNMSIARASDSSPTPLSFKFGEGYERVTSSTRSGPVTIFNNRAARLYYYMPVSNTDEFVDEGSFHFQGVNGSEQINGLVFDYCSSLPDPIGTAITVELRFYEEVVAFQGVTGWMDANNRNEKCGYSLTGLPGNTAGGFSECWTVSLDLTGGYECTLPQEQTSGSGDTFGWSAIYMDALNSADTGPGSVTIYGPGYPAYGIENWVEYYQLTQPLGSEYLGTWWFGFHPRGTYSWWLALQATPTDTAAYYSANSGTVDTVDLQADVEVRPGQAAGWTVNNPYPGSNYALIASAGAADVPGLAGGNAHLLVNWLGNPLLPAPLVMTNASYSQALPAVLPPNLHVQAAEYTGVLTPSNITAMSNGLRHAN